MAQSPIIDISSTRNPFGAMEPKSSNAIQPATNRGGNAIADATTAREQSEVQGMILLAKKFPRSEQQAVDRILNACTRPSLAEGAVYQYARGGSDVSGPSIRLAEAIAQNWGNLNFGVRELEQRNGESTVEAFAWDLETNTRQTKVFQVAHLRYTKQGTKVLTDPRDIYEMVANQGARRVRACILGLIPGDVVDAAVAQCDATLRINAGEVTPERIKGMVAKFAEFGVTREQIEARIQRRIDSVTAAQLVSLGKVYNSIRDGMSVAADWFEPMQTPTSAPAAAQPAKNGNGTSKLADKLGLSKPKPAPAEPALTEDDAERQAIQEEAQ